MCRSPLCVRCGQSRGGEKRMRLFEAGLLAVWVHQPITPSTYFKIAPADSTRSIEFGCLQLPTQETSCHKQMLLGSTNARVRKPLPHRGARASQVKTSFQYLSTSILDINIAIDITLQYRQCRSRNIRADFAVAKMECIACCWAPEIEKVFNL